MSVPTTSPPVTSAPAPGAPTAPDRPVRRRKISQQQLLEVGGSALSSLAAVWVVFTVLGISSVIGMLIVWYGLFLAVYGFICWRAHGLLAMKDRVATVVIWSGGLVTLIPLVAVILYVVIKGAPIAMAHFPNFWIKDMSQLGATTPPSDVGAGAAIVGTMEQVGITAVLAVPLGILTATYLADTDTIFSRLVGYVVDAMTGAPAIIAGLYIYILWVAPHKHNGKTGFAAGMALAVMMLPVVTRASQEVVAIVPGSLREAALALGAPQWRVMMRIVLPTARAGLMTAVILGIARVAGETAPVLFTAGGNPFYNWNPFSGQQDSLPLRIYELIFQPGSNVIAMAWGVSFVLVVVVLVLFVIARLAGADRVGRRRRIPRLLGRNT